MRTGLFLTLQFRRSARAANPVNPFTMNAPQTTACLVLLMSLSCTMPVALAQVEKSKPVDFRKNRLELINARAEEVTYKGRASIQLLPLEGKQDRDENLLGVIAGPEFTDGVIEVELAGRPRPGSAPTSRGFIGIAFRVQSHGSGYECFYLRPSNARVEDQLQRNHSIQYVSEPGFGWRRLRREQPGMYESYADLAVGEWSKVRIVVLGTKARIYVNGSEQAALIVNDLKRGASSGRIALWSHSSTEGYFTGLKVERQR